MIFFKAKNVSVKNASFIYLVYGATTFLSAFLLFLVQPLISKYILPWFGGTASVWTVVMLFFQTTLLLGYLYAHLISKYLNLKKQATLHICLLLGSLILLPILPGNGWRPGANDNPILHILILLSICTGLQAVILSATSPLIQSWIAKIKIKDSPYQLYALSNAGSLIALLGFPFLMEPFFPIKVQSNLWSLLFVIFVLCFIVCMFWLLKYGNIKNINKVNNSAGVREPKPTIKINILWLTLSAITSILLLAITNKISQDISVVPLFWVVPLSLYLISFIIPFSSDAFVRWFLKNLFYILLFSGIIGFYFFVLLSFTTLKLCLIATYLFVLFMFSLVCNTELVRTRPGNKHLTVFYLMIALGGVIGAIITGIIAPLIFNSYLELPLVLIFSFIITLAILFKEKLSLIYLISQQNFAFKKPIIIGSAVFIIYLLLIGSAGILFIFNTNLSTIESARNFYGTLKVKESKVQDLNNKMLYLLSGSIIHGSQFAEQSKRYWPTTYYGEKSGIGLTFQYFINKNLRVGAIGLGAGTVATFGKKNDYIKFYEVNPQVVYLNNKYFSFLKDSQAKIEIELGDGRLSMENEKPQNFNIIVVDAFTGDSIPVHLLTKEAIEIYLKNLAADGVIAFDVSNKYLDLRPVILKLAKTFNLQGAVISVAGDNENGTTPSSWILLSRNSQFFKSPLITQSENNEIVKIDNFNLWTDDYSNLFSVLTSPFSNL